jgi:hypothetical protein
MNTDSYDMKYIKNELKFMFNIDDINNLKLIEEYGISKFAEELKIWEFSDRSIFTKLKK